MKKTIMKTLKCLLLILAITVAIIFSIGGLYISLTKSLLHILLFVLSTSILIVALITIKDIANKLKC